MKCPRCGADLKDGAKFCAKCGGKIGDIAAAAPVQVKVQPPEAAPAAGRPQSAPRAASASSFDNLYNHDKFLFNQKFSIREMYSIYDEKGNDLFFVKGVFFALKKHLWIYTDRNKTNLSMEILQDAFFMFLKWRYTLVDANGTVLARFHRNTLMSILRRSWEVLTPDGQLICKAEEDSWVKAIIRRFMPFGEFLKTDFIITTGNKEIGKFVRKWTVMDKYAMDLTQDPDRILERHVAVGLAIMLDSGERR